MSDRTLDPAFDQPGRRRCRRRFSVSGENEFYLGYPRERAPGVVFGSVKDVTKKA